MSVSTRDGHKVSKMFYLHVGITFLFMFGFGFLPTIGSITPIGMKVLGIFIGLIYAWTTLSMLWPSMLGMFAILSTGMFPMKEFLGMSFGNNIVVFMFLAMIFSAVISELGLTAVIANWFCSRKISFGKPWLFSFFVLLGAFTGGALVNPMATVLIFWSVFYIIAKQVGLKPFDKYCTLMIFGIVFAAMVAGSTSMPFKMAGLLLFSTVQSTAGVTLRFSQYVLYSIPTALLLLVAYILICKFIFRPDVSALKALTDDFVDKEALILNKRQKVGFLFLFLFMLFLLGPEILPKAIPGVEFLKRVGAPGIALLILAVMHLLKVDGEPIIDFKQAVNKGVIWNNIMLIAVVLPMSSILSSEPTGITPFIINSLTPILSHFSPLVFVVVITLAMTILTNFVNNAVLSVLFVNLLCPIAVGLGIDPVPICMSFIWFANLAFLTPAASTPAAVLFGNNEWIKPTDLYKMVPIILGCLYVVVLLIILPIAMQIF